MKRFLLLGLAIFGFVAMTLSPISRVLADDPPVYCCDSNGMEFYGDGSLVSSNPDTVFSPTAVGSADAAQIYSTGTQYGTPIDFALFDYNGTLTFPSGTWPGGDIGIIGTYAPDSNPDGNGSTACCPGDYTP